MRSILKTYTTASLLLSLLLARTAPASDLYAGLANTKWQTYATTVRFVLQGSGATWGFQHQCDYVDGYDPTHWGSMAANYTNGALKSIIDGYPGVNEPERRYPEGW
ncbi:hypothetical protein ATT74_22115 [Salmonella enterica subsp. enterica serovar Panama]|uniref:Uncharacterized protein n=1 Tax=Salmonella enterica subsp. enterica serovar Panama TaxID=29472 RepID=A0A619AK24_SALET|nr:hypothetical protein [Salmonella enterica subsp. enterica serovar Panama]EGU5383797.1 hypothetical protein [Salmonella enterica]ECX3497853.1 hypothetical protein [Salmonella enterica subsp. enterica serovar Panama]ECX6035216.1 hypothetical protein [Salmonella enterica subsp. enterica serovar Panama]EGX1720113.1 hypothetical protein [Salmonella enterica subsp. enterica serovar Panama]